MKKRILLSLLLIMTLLFTGCLIKRKTSLQEGTPDLTDENSFENINVMLLRGKNWERLIETSPIAADLFLRIDGSTATIPVTAELLRQFYGYSDKQVQSSPFINHSTTHQAYVNLIGGILYSYWPYDYTQPVDKPASWKLAVQGMRDVAGFAADHGVTLGMEVVNRFEHYMLNTAEEGIRFVKEVDRPNVRVMLDCFHMNIEEDWHGDAIRATGDLLCHFHIGEANRKVPGQGHMPWDEIGKGLRDIGYDKAVVMEPFVKPGGTVGREIKVWRDLSNGADGERLDREIAEALQFVKKKFVG